VASSTALNLEAISKAIRQHNDRCQAPVVEIRMNPFEVERLGFDTFEGLPIIGDKEIGTGRFRLLCERDLGGQVKAAEKSVPVPA
jgi:hypothetical protein